MSEIFREIKDKFGLTHGHFLTGSLTAEYMSSRSAMQALMVAENMRSIDNGIGFIDCSAIEISRADYAGLQNVVLNRHKRKQAIKFQAVKLVNALLEHVYDTMEGQRHCCTGVHLKWSGNILGFPPNKG